MMKNFLTRALSALALLALLVVAPVAAQEAVVAGPDTADSATLQAIPSTTPEATAVAPGAAATPADVCAAEAAQEIVDPTPMQTGELRSKTFDQALEVTGLSMLTILAVMAAFGGLTAFLTRLIPARDED